MAGQDRRKEIEMPERGKKYQEAAKLVDRAKLLLAG